MIDEDDRFQYTFKEFYSGFMENKSLPNRPHHPIKWDFQASLIYLTMLKEKGYIRGDIAYGMIIFYTKL